MFTLSDLERIVAERAGVTDGSSHTASLVSRGPAVCARKFGEEAVETVVAALDGAKSDLAAEAADALYHLLVLLHARGVKLSEVMEVLEGRTGRSGIEEKASRKAGKAG